MTLAAEPSGFRYDVSRRRDTSLAPLHLADIELLFESFMARLVFVSSVSFPVPEEVPMIRVTKVRVSRSIHGVRLGLAGARRHRVKTVAPPIR